MYLTTVKQDLHNSFDLNYLRKMYGTWDQCPAKLFVSVRFATKTEPTPNDLLVLDKTRYQRNAVQALAAQLSEAGAMKTCR